MQSTVFPVVMYGCESWTVKKAEHRKIDAFELWCWRRLLRVPWTARRSSQFILKEISPGCSLEELMLKLKLQYFSHLTWFMWSLRVGHNWATELNKLILGLRCCSRAFSSCEEQELLSSCGTRASYHIGISFCEARALECWLSHCDTQV